MPPLNEVKKLHLISLNVALDAIFNDIRSVELSSDTMNAKRSYYSCRIEPNLKEILLKLAFFRNRITTASQLRLLDLVAGPSLSSIPPYTIGKLFPSANYADLLLILNKRACVGIKELVIMTPHEELLEWEKSVISHANNLLSSLLPMGLGRNLTTVVLNGCANNEILRSLGKHCEQLKKLDIIGSWDVDDNGFNMLCLKNPKLLGELPPWDEIEAGDFIDLSMVKMLAIPEGSLNPCCNTLNTINWQRTRISGYTLNLVLVCVKNLTSVGGFVYARNVSDSICLLGLLSPTPRVLKLQNLYDMVLPTFKINLLVPMLPDLDTIYTRSMYVDEHLAAFRTVTTLTLDGAYHSYLFRRYLEAAGMNLKRLILVDQDESFDAVTIFEYCPNLEKLSAVIELSDPLAHNPLQYLDHVEVGLHHVDILVWLLMNAPLLEYLKVSLKPIHHQLMHGEIEPHFTSKRLKEIIRLDPECFKTIKIFKIDVNFPQTFSRRVVMRLINSCPNLYSIGMVYAWGLSPKNFRQIGKQLKKRNLNILLDREDFGDSWKISDVSQLHGFDYELVV